MRYVLSALGGLSLLFSTSVSEGAFCAQTTTNNTQVVVVFGNGIMNTKQDAERSINLLQEDLRESLSPEEFNRIEFTVAYNHSYGLINDLYESLKQRVATDNVVTSFWRWLGGQEALPEEVRQEFMAIATRFDFSTLVAPEDLENHVQLYQTKIGLGKKVVVVSHSQGNFFANDAHQIIYGSSNRPSTRSLGIVSVANPASFVADNGPYTTLLEDRVIGAIALATPMGISPSLSPNITNMLSGTESGDWRGHSFMEAYMVPGSNSAIKIVQDIVGMMSSLELPFRTMEDGVVTVTLSWIPHADLDLHVFEPDGNHVSYTGTQGHGFLGLDSSSGNVPEEYYIPCASLISGTYRIGVNYFRGISPMRGFVQVNAGAIVRGFWVALPSELGSSGDANPVPAATIVVTGNPTEGFEFEVLPPS